MCRLISIAIACFLSFSVSSEILTWVDENGKTHFGDKVPIKYQDQSTEVSLDMHVPTEQERQEAMRRLSAAEKSNREAAQKRRQKERLAEYSRPRRKSNKSMTHQQRYEASRACFSRCSTENVEGGRNNAGCGHCESVKKPNL